MLCLVVCAADIVRDEGQSEVMPATVTPAQRKQPMNVANTRTGPHRTTNRPASRRASNGVRQMPRRTVSRPNQSQHTQLRMVCAYISEPSAATSVIMHNTVTTLFFNNMGFYCASIATLPQSWES